MWKYSFITHIFKNGDSSVKENYRPISITCIMSMVSEKILTNSITSLFITKFTFISIAIWFYKW